VDEDKYHCIEWDKFRRWQQVMACLLDHYLDCYEQNDGQDMQGMRDALGKEAEELVPTWRDRRDEWEPKAI
jgi:hypothetical protein